MGRALLIASRAPLAPDLADRTRAFFTKLAPDNITPRPPKLTLDDHTLLAELDPPLEACTFTADELRTDFIASRAIWYVHTRDLFAASTSQRALAFALRSFEENREAFAWMLSSGSLGPRHGWDRRARMLGPGGRLHLDRRTFELTVTEEPIRFHAEPARAHEAELSAALEELFASLTLDPERWIVPLSGGFDSRALLLLSKQRFRTLTWGLRKALDDPKTDAFIAREVARALGLENRYFETDLAREPIDRLFDRFLVAGEGRIDHFAGYMDGFAVWRHLHESGVAGILRGDEGFGWVPVTSMLDARHSVGMASFRDYAGEPFTLEGATQSLPDDLQPLPGESAATYRDRLYHAFRIPCVLGALTELKSAYVETKNPFLDRRLLELVRTQPDHLRTSKALFKSIITKRSPAIPFAERAATADPRDILASRPATEMLRDTLASSSARALLGADLCKKLEPADSGHGLRRRVLRELKQQAKRRLPAWLKRKLRNTALQHRLDRRATAFRAYLIVRTVAMLRADARA